MTYPAILDRTHHATCMWLNDIEEETGENRQHCYHALKAVLHALRDNLPVAESANLAAQLPMLIRGLYYGEWNPAAQGAKVRSKKKFLEQVEKGLQPIGAMDAEAACRGVFKTLSHHISPGEVEKARDCLAKPVRALWPERQEEDGPEDEPTQDVEESKDEASEDDYDDGNIHRFDPAGRRRGGETRSDAYADDEDYDYARSISARDDEEREPGGGHLEPAERGYGRYVTDYPHMTEDEQARGWDDDGWKTGNRQSYGYDDTGRERARRHRRDR